jgi:hypothetical protein
MATKDEVVQAVAEYQDGTWKVRDTTPFLWGKMHTLKEDNGTNVLYVWEDPEEDVPLQVLNSPHEMILLVSKLKTDIIGRESWWERFWRKIGPAEIVAAIIAFCFVGIIVWQLKSQQQIPEFLSNGLTLILGFYFGKSVPDTAQSGAARRQ